MTRLKRPFCFAAIATCALLFGPMPRARADGPTTITLTSKITQVQPMTGIVLWSDNDKAETDAIQLEYRYCGYNEVVGPDGSYDFAKLDLSLIHI